MPPAASRIRTKAPPQKTPRRKPPPPRRRRLLPKLSLLLALALAAGAWLVFHDLPDPAPLTRTLPRQSVIMRARVAEAGRQGRSLRIFHQPVALSRVAPVLQRAVVLGEDARFWAHEGIDWAETRRALEEALEQKKLPRGASTLTQQLAKNLYLSENRSPIRKAREWAIAVRLERTLGKKRILEIYLNVAEWGDGVFGIEAAARTHFQKSAAELDAGEAAVLAAMLPSPRNRSPRAPTPALVRRAYRMADLLASDGAVRREDVRARVHALVGPEP